MALDFLDIVSYRPVLTIFGKDRYKTIVGKIVGSLTMLSILILCIYFTVETFLRSEISIVYNLVSDSASTINLSNTPMLMILTDALMNPLPDKYYEIRVNFWNYTKDSTGANFVYQIEEYPLSPSPPGISLGADFSLLKNINLTDWKYLPPQKHNITLYGSLNTPAEFSFLNIVVNMCNNHTTNNTCPDKSVLAQVLENSYLFVIYLDNYVDNSDYAHPIKTNIGSETFPIGWALNQRYLYSFNNIKYSTDEGKVFQSIVTDTNYKFSQTTNIVSIRHGSALYPLVTIGSVTMCRDSKDDVYNRSYPKLQTLLARIGGVIQGIMLIGELMCHFISKNLFLTHVVNFNFDNNLELEEEPKKYNLKQIRLNNASNMMMKISNGPDSNTNIINFEKKLRIDEEPTKNRFKPNWFNIIFPSWIGRNKKMKYLNQTNSVVSKYMSFENLFEHLIQYERLKKVLLSDEQRYVLDNLPKLKVGALQENTVPDKDELMKNIQFIQLHKQIEVNKKLITFFE